MLVVLMRLKNIYFEKNEKNFKLFNGLIFISSITLYFFNSFIFKNLNWFFLFYFSDLLSSIVLFSFINSFYPIKLTNCYIIIIITIFASFVWEYLALFIKLGSVFDLNDILCYFISSLIYIILIKFYKFWN